MLCCPIKVLRMERFTPVCCVTSYGTKFAVELPQVNVLSKVDLVEKYGRLHFGLDFYTDVLDLSHLADLITVRAPLQFFTGFRILLATYRWSSKACYHEEIKLDVRSVEPALKNATNFI